MTSEDIATLIAEACALLDGPRRDEGAFMKLAALRAELLEAATAADEPELVDDCCEVAAQLEERLVAMERSWEVLATPA